MPKRGNPFIEMGNRIRLARERRVYTQRTLGSMLGVPFQRVQQYEQGSKLSLDRIYTIADVLAIDPDWLLTGESPTEITPITSLRLGFYGRNAGSTAVVDADAHVKAACGLPESSRFAWDRWYNRIHSDDRLRVTSELRRLETEGVFEMQYRLIGWDGVERCIIDRGHMVLDDSTGQPMRLQGMMIDITRVPRTKTTDCAIKHILAVASRRQRDDGQNNGEAH
jgi:transcriptional regulator with XRE-family HTH domain